MSEQNIIQNNTPQNKEETVSSVQEQQKKYHDFKSIFLKPWVIVLSIFFVFVVVPLFGYVYYDFAVNRNAIRGMETQFTIESGESLTQVSRRLYNQGLVNSEFLFRFYLIVNGQQQSIQAGDYKIPAGSSIVELARLFQHGVNDKSITFIEGWRVEEFAKAASDTFDKVDYEDFILRARDLEGYLFPDTYIFNSDVTEKQMISTLKDTFELKTQDLLIDENLESLGLTEKEVLTFASMVEREVYQPEERKKVAGILLKRYREGIPLGVDATTQYVIAPLRYGCAGTPPDVVCPDGEEIPNVEWWPDDLTQSELDLEDPYNTRAVPGLPPAPISSVSLSSIESVINYQETPYYFYLTGNDGNTYFSETYEEHQLNIQRYLR